MYKFKEDQMLIPAYVWQQEGAIETSAIEQLKTIASLPFAFHHVVICPDGHLGYGMPIGGVVAFKGVISPNCVGVDIGCGLSAVKTSITEISTERLKEIMTLIRKWIPLGFEHHSKAQDEWLMPERKYGKQDGDSILYERFSEKEHPVCYQEYNSALKQLGTLGGGNHFIELQKGSDAHIWFMIHSGSRNLGYKVAKHYNELAQKLCAKWHSNIPQPKGEDGLAFLPVDTEEGKAYLREMQYCLDFAKANRALMAERIKQAFNCTPCKECNGDGGIKGNKCNNCNGDGFFEYPHGFSKDIETRVSFLNEINIHHNYASLESHFGENVWIHRKGATSAKEGEIGLIPGSQGTSSYVVRGKGNPESFMSCSHGAGRKMGRKEAIRSLNLEEEKKRLNEKGVIHAIRNQNDLEEAAGAYKDIDVVMKEQEDLVDIVVKLEPLAVIKG